MSSDATTSYDAATSHLATPAATRTADAEHSEPSSVYKKRRLANVKGSVFQALEPQTAADKTSERAGRETDGASPQDQEPAEDSRQDGPVGEGDSEMDELMKMVAEKKRQLEGKRMVETLQSQVDKGKAIPFAVPAFDNEAMGSPFVWNNLVATLYWGNKTKRKFEPIPGAEVDVNRVMEFLEKRFGPEGEPVSRLVGEPEPDGSGWYRLPWLAFEGENSLPATSTSGSGRSDWQRAWHGCKFESLYSIMYHGRLAASRDSGEGERFFEGAPGVYLHKDGTAKKAGFYMRFVPLCNDGVFWGALWEVWVDREDKVTVPQKTDQWVQQERSVRLAALWLAGATYEGMNPGWEVVESWNPKLECNPKKKHLINYWDLEKSIGIGRGGS